VFLCIVAIEGAILIPSVRSFERDLLLRLEESSLNALAAVVEIHGSEETSADLTQLEAPLARATSIRGGILLGPNDEPVAVFGETPDIDFNLTPTSNNRLDRFVTGRSRTAGGTRYDVRWPRDMTGLTGDIIVRLEASWIDPELVSFVLRIAALVLMISIFVSGGAMIVLGRSILTPMLQVRAAVIAASEDPARADSYGPEYNRRNEMGELVAALNDLLGRISRTHREELAMLNAMVNETSVAITACNEIGEAVYANDAALSLLGCWSLDEMREKGLPCFQRSYGGGESLNLNELLADGGFAGEATLITAAVDPVPGFVNAGILTNDDDQPLRYYATIADFSKVREAQVRLQQRNLELAAAERAKSKFLANMSHEFRTPLNAIIGFSELIGDELDVSNSSTRHRGFIEDIRKSGVHLHGIINDVLDMAKIESGAMNLRVSDISVTDVIDDALRMVTQQIEEKRLMLRVDIDKQIPSVRADEIKFRQILLNLLSNAVKFTPEGGTISVGASSRRVEKLGACLEIVIGDTGVGIAPDELETILEPFAQGSTANQQQLGGTGLGLTLCKALAEAHDGAITIDSEINKGTRAILHIPLKNTLKNAVENAA
jgi:signal transduction histidine kinase